jgi:membrane protein DedA with SNARE-associated domain
MPDVLQPFTAWLVAHTYVVVFVAALVDATGLPVPGRILLIAAGAVAGAADASILVAIVLGAVGVAITDHAWYFAGALAGGRLLNLYCRLPIDADQCRRRAAELYRRFGTLTILVGRFMASVRMLAWPLARAHGVDYPRFVIAEVLGALVWSTVWIGAGWLLGERWTEAAGEARWVGPAVLVAAVATALSVRVWRRRRGVVTL